MTRRATTRGAARTSLEGTTADVLICGASFAGLAVARELAGTGADVLILDRYALGERATSACAAPTLWLRAMGVEDAIRKEIPYMRFTTPHGSVRYRLPWSWSSFDYRELCRLLFAQTDARLECATVTGLADTQTEPSAVHTDRGTISAPLTVDALGWRRVLAPGDPYQPPAAPLSRGLEVHPDGDGHGDELHVWIERDLVRRGYGWSVPAHDHLRVGVGSYEPRDHVRDPTERLAGRLHLDSVRYQGNWFPHRLRPAAEAGVFFVGDSAGHCFALSGEGIRTAFYFGIACGRELRAVLAGAQTREDALTRYAHFSARHARAYGLAWRLQRLIPSLPPRALTVLLRALSSQRAIDKAFGWYLDQAHPDFARAAAGTGAHASPQPHRAPAEAAA